MAIFDCFKSTKELENEKRREIRRNERKVDQDLENFNEKIAALAKQRDAAWSQARELFKSGRKDDAKRILLYYKRYDLLIDKLEKQKAYLTGQAIQIRSTGNAAATLADIRTLAADQNINPDNLAANIDEMDIIAQDIAENDKQMNAAFDRDLGDMAKAEATSEIPYEDDDLMAALENECVAEIDGQTAPPSEKTSDTAAGIAEGAERLKKLLNGK